MKLEPSTYLREPCVFIREGGREASVAVHVARDIEHRKRWSLGRRGFSLGRRQHVRSRYGERAYRPTVSETPWTHVRVLSGPGRSPCCPATKGGAAKVKAKAERRMYGKEKSDTAIIAVKPTNKAWKTTGRSWWSEGPYPRGNREVPHVPDSELDTACPREWIDYGCGLIYQTANVMRGSATRGRSRMR